MQRYEVNYQGRFYSTGDGKWCKYDDAMNRIAELEEMCDVQENGINEQIAFIRKLKAGLRDAKITGIWCGDKDSPKPALLKLQGEVVATFCSRDDHNAAIDAVLGKKGQA